MKYECERKGYGIFLYEQHKSLRAALQIHTISINLLTVEVRRAVRWSVLCVEYCVLSLKCFVGAVCCYADYGGYLWLSVD